jgi:hypothetical protein
MSTPAIASPPPRPAIVVTCAPPVAATRAPTPSAYRPDVRILGKVLGRASRWCW